jgi:hypothetical protein
VGVDYFLHIHTIHFDPIAYIRVEPTSFPSSLCTLYTMVLDHPMKEADFMSGKEKHWFRAKRYQLNTSYIACW